MGRIVEATDLNFEQEVSEATLPVLVNFWAVWCGPCRQIAPVFEELSVEYEGKIKFMKANVDEVTEPVGRYGVMSIPTLILFKGGSPMEMVVGLQPKTALQEVLDKYI
ncbi:MAG TPA: thioredoxin [Firmicutes bacterium]|nr:thioredoxin [Bacillota bacterium]